MNKTAAAVGLVMFGIFIIVVYIELEEIRQQSAIPCPTQTVTTQAPCNLSSVSTFLYAVYAELNHTNSILTEVYSHEYPHTNGDRAAPSP